MRYVIGVAVVLLAAGAAYWFWQATPSTPAQSVDGIAPPPTTSDETDEAPRYPLPEAGQEDKPSLRPLPGLDESDEYFRMEMTDLLGEESATMFRPDALIERLVAAVDNLPRQRVAERVRPLAAPEAPFEVDSQDGSGEYQLGQSNYRRYDAVVQQFTDANLEQSVELYQRFYPLFQKAYVGLGYPQGYFNDRLVEVIDHLLATPEVNEPVMLVRPHVLYRFSDESLEALSAGQKLMIRVGPRHRQAIAAKLRELRKLLIAKDQR